MLSEQTEVSRAKSTHRGAALAANLLANVRKAQVRNFVVFTETPCLVMAGISFSPALTTERWLALFAEGDPER
jgi:hypothetical protein